jgi:hypothetical protein
MFAGPMTDAKRRSSSAAVSGETESNCASAANDVKVVNDAKNDVKVVNDEKVANAANRISSRIQILTRRVRRLMNACYGARSGTI